MNVLPIISVLLGLISVLITLKFVKLYEGLDRNLKKMTLIVGGKNTKDPLLLDLQNTLNITDTQFGKILFKSKDKILTVLRKKIKEQRDANQSATSPIKKEEFINYKKHAKAKAKSKYSRKKY